ncbi:MAG: hypothetical protein GQ474_08065 [Sulfurimonas sp.]|nr:hypothetical protein [Sulfurimonas sp.]
MKALQGNVFESKYFRLLGEQDEVTLIYRDGQTSEHKAIDLAPSDFSTLAEADDDVVQFIVHNLY